MKNKFLILFKGKTVRISILKLKVTYKRQEILVEVFERTLALWLPTPRVSHCFNPQAQGSPPLASLKKSEHHFGVTDEVPENEVLVEEQHCSVRGLCVSL